MPYPSTSSAYGIWSLNEVRDAVRGDNWPDVPVLVIPEATTSNTTASSLRSGSTLADFFQAGNYGVFATPNAGENLTTDFGSSVVITQVTYKNEVGTQWAPTSVLIQSSADNSSWTTRLTYSDNNTRDLQTLTISGGASARYWRIYQNSNTRGGASGFEWHLGSYTMTGPAQ